MGKIFWVEFQRVPLKLRTLKDMIFTQYWKFKSSQILRARERFWNAAQAMIEMRGSHDDVMEMKLELGIKLQLRIISLKWH